MKNKGFTLVEIIVVISLLAIIGVGSTVGIVISNNKKQETTLLENTEKFSNALDVYLSTHDEVVNNINYNTEGAIISLELLKNEGLINGDLNINYKDNYYIVTNALLSNKNLTEECENSIELNVIASWVKDNDSSNVLYFCPKTPDNGTGIIPNTGDVIDEDKVVVDGIVKDKDTGEIVSIVNDPQEACDNGLLSPNSFVCQIINNTKQQKNENDLTSTVFGEDSRNIPKESVTRKQQYTVNITNSDFNRDLYFFVDDFYDVLSNNVRNYYSVLTTKERNEILTWVSDNLKDGKDVYFNPYRNCSYYRDSTTRQYHYTCKRKNENASKIVSVSDSCTKNGCEIIYQLVDTYNSTQRSLLTSEDDYGVSYYYKGNVVDNYVNFAGMCWRIVRIQGDGSVKLILSSKNNTCENDDKDSTLGYGAYGGWRYSDDAKKLDYEYGQYGVSYTDTRRSGSTFVRDEMSGFYSDNLKDYDSKIKKERLCLQNYNIDEFGNVVTDNTLLKCNGNKTSYLSVGPLMYSEVNQASDNGSSYLDFMLSEFKNTYTNTGYCANDVNFWTITPVDSSDFEVHTNNGTSLGVGDGDVRYGYAECSAGSRPAIVVKNTVISTGTGTITDPYVIN